jgi:hypothetical protein
MPVSSRGGAFVDFVYLALIALFFAAVVGLGYGCDALHRGRK